MANKNRNQGNEGASRDTTGSTTSENQRVRREQSGPGNTEDDRSVADDRESDDDELDDDVLAESDSDESSVGDGSVTGNRDTGRGGSR
jgi:hypothetical protein